MLQKLDDLRRLDAAREKAKIEVPDRNARDRELRQKFCYPGWGAKEGKRIRGAKSDCYRGRNGQNHESKDTRRSINEVAAALPERWGEAQTQAIGSSAGTPGLSSQGGHPSFARAGGSARSTDYYRASTAL